jgi:hypothetical protein
MQNEIRDFMELEASKSGLSGGSENDSNGFEVASTPQRIQSIYAPHLLSYFYIFHPLKSSSPNWFTSEIRQQKPASVSVCVYLS